MLLLVKQGYQATAVALSSNQIAPRRHLVAVLWPCHYPILRAVSCTEYRAMDGSWLLFNNSRKKPKQLFQTSTSSRFSGSHIHS